MLLKARVDEVEGLDAGAILPHADAIGPPEQKFRAFEQIFGANRQVPHVGGCDKEADTAARRTALRSPNRLAAQNREERQAVKGAKCLSKTQR